MSAQVVLDPFGEAGERRVEFATPSRASEAHSVRRAAGVQFGGLEAVPDGVPPRGHRGGVAADQQRLPSRNSRVRGGWWWDLCAVRVHGRSLTVPGAFTSSRWDAGFEQKPAMIREYWSRAVSG
ncbi:hypothetical protein ACWCQ0_29810 [Streptomyces massasporeus]|uniref:hypothetical protein n=1 Tax=Streptomyces massasporeus TaxID=67324 RepID=UPI0033F4BC73